MQQFVAAQLPARGRPPAVVQYSTPPIETLRQFVSSMDSFKMAGLLSAASWPIKLSPSFKRHHAFLDRWMRRLKNKNCSGRRPVDRDLDVVLRRQNDRAGIGGSGPSDLRKRQSDDQIP